MFSPVDWNTRVENLVANTRRLIVQSNPRRIMLSLVNLSGSDVFISPRSTVSATGDDRGTPLLANYGNAIQFKIMVGKDGRMNVYPGEVWAICTGTASIAVSEESEVD
jgi:hypothetical protein